MVVFGQNTATQRQVYISPVCYIDNQTRIHGRITNTDHSDKHYATVCFIMLSSRQKTFIGK